MRSFLLAVGSFRGVLLGCISQDGTVQAGGRGQEVLIQERHTEKRVRKQAGK
jgi:hypothetical protein